MVFGASAPVAATGTLEHEVHTGDCVQIAYATFADSLRVIADGGREIALGFTLDEPGEGLAFVVYIAPEVCTGASGSRNAAPTIPDVEKDLGKLDKCPTYPAMP